MDPSFVNYRQDQLSLEELLDCTFVDLGVDTEHAQAAEAFLAPLKAKGGPYYYTFLHCIRVGLLGKAVAEFMHLSRRTMFFAGVLHDVGKLQVPATTLGKTQGWTEEDTRLVRRHVMDGYRMLAGRFDFTAEVLLWHHRFQSAGYPKTILAPLHEYCLGTKVLIPMLGRILSLCDVYDALHRINDKHGEKRAPTGEEIKELMLKFNQDQKQLVEDLYTAGVFTTYTQVPTTA
ncbi:MAG TPA: HD domain-containing protein [Verrucomicrobiae bacterium]|nr:HD domain-containing protein [Verrucomicrobiae bacterium]